MRGRLAAVIWLAIGVAIWNGFYDLYVSRGAREYLQLAAETELGRREPPSMSAVGADRRRGLGDAQVGKEDLKSWSRGDVKTGSSSRLHDSTTSGLHDLTTFPLSASQPRLDLG
jgi:hypothetical protein